MQVNWLASCAGLFKAETVGAEYFDPDIQYLEWTYSAFHLALTRKISFVPEPTYIIHDTPGSLSEDDAYVEAQSTVLERMLDFKMPPSLRRKLRLKLSNTQHDLSDHYHRRNATSAAWKYHLRSMAEFRGMLRYVLYTRRLLAPKSQGND